MGGGQSVPSSTWKKKKAIAERHLKYHLKSVPIVNKLNHCAIIKFSQIIKSVMKKVEDNNTLVSIVFARSNKHQIKQKKKKKKKLYEIATINILIRLMKRKGLDPEYNKSE